MPTLNSLVKGTGRADVGDLDELEPVAVMERPEGLLKLCRVGAPHPHGAPDDVALAEKRGGRVGGNVSVGARNKDSAASLNVHGMHSLAR